MLSAKQQRHPCQSYAAAGPQVETPSVVREDAAIPRQQNIAQAAQRAQRHESKGGQPPAAQGAVKIMGSKQ